MEAPHVFANHTRITASDADMLSYNPFTLSTPQPSGASSCDSVAEAAPQFPYAKGSKFTAWRHCPAAPFGWDYTTLPPTEHLTPTEISQEELCYSRQPLTGHTDLTDSKDLTITSCIRTGPGRGPQLVLVNDEKVAKIYDPMYYSSDEGADVVWCADKAYTREAAAYEHLSNTSGISDLVPAFHGTWTFDVDTTIIHGGVPTVCRRSVRMILIEHLVGQSMDVVDAHTIPECIRTKVLKQCLDAEIRLLHAGVNHGDLCPRNIILLGLDHHESDVHVKIIDFDISTVYEHPAFEDPDYVQSQKEFAKRWAPKLTSPIMRFFGHMAAFSCAGWCPSGHRGAEQWLWRNYAHDKRYIAVQWNPNQELDDPVYENNHEAFDCQDDVRGDDVVSHSGSETDESSSTNSRCSTASSE